MGLLEYAVAPGSQDLAAIPVDAKYRPDLAVEDENTVVRVDCNSCDLSGRKTPIILWPTVDDSIRDMGVRSELRQSYGSQP